MASDGIERREFLKKIPLFGAGLALGLSALADSGETPKARKFGGEGTEPNDCTAGVSCNVGVDCNVGSISRSGEIECKVGTER